MKIIKVISFSIVVSILFFSCEKGIDFSAKVSRGSLQSTAGECLPKNIGGVYQEGITFTSNNYIDVHVTIDSIGAYLIKTDTVNGYSFKGEGVLGVKGDNRVRLYGSGRPLSTGVNTFIIDYNGTFCNYDVTIL